MITNDLQDPWEVGETVLFGGTINDLPTGADPTDYTVSFKIWQSGSLVDTMTDTLDSSSNYEINHTLDSAIVAGDIDVYMYLVWDSTKYNRLGVFTRNVKATKYTS